MDETNLWPLALILFLNEGILCQTRIYWIINCFIYLILQVLHHCQLINLAHDFMSLLFYLPLYSEQQLDSLHSFCPYFTFILPHFFLDFCRLYSDFENNVRTLTTLLLLKNRYKINKLRLKAVIYV